SGEHDTADHNETALESKTATSEPKSAMKLIPAKFLLTLGLVAASLLPAIAADPNADQILKQMCAKLAAARQFSFKAHREMDPALVPGRSEVAQSADVEVTVQRPNKVMAKSETENGERQLYADGKTFSLLDVKMNFYTTIPM